MEIGICFTLPAADEGMEHCGSFFQMERLEENRVREKTNISIPMSLNSSASLFCSATTISPTNDPALTDFHSRLIKPCFPGG
ncbi:Uncharacterized protein TCM_006552 [Theobroma cacao]|uniref:Uncharacterized protein n=1 Tax=Theobroma cacao TaxID=3641 RepID=A0A061DZQ9_THECC|nr:Uncharacterized protein TCM_006552 [Theobroma cacao]